MAKKLYRSNSLTLEVVYDGAGNKYEVVPNGTVEGDEADFGKYGVLKEVKPEKKDATKK